MKSPPVCPALAVFVAALYLATPCRAQGPAPAPTPARAAPAPQPAAPEEYGRTIEEALHEYDARRFVEARALFIKAHARYPNARTQRGLGMVEFELGNYADSVTWLEAALASEVRPLDATLRAHVEGLLERARSFVARYALQIRPTPEGLQLTVDGVRMAVPAGQPLTLSIGEHVIQAQAPGYEPAARVLDVRGGETTTLVIELRAPQQPVPGAAQPDPAATTASTDTSIWRSPWLWAGAGGIIAGVGTALLLTGLARANDAEERMASADTGSDWDAAKADYDGAKSLNTAGWIVAGTGVVTAATGIVIVSMMASRETRRAGLQVTPWVSTRAAGLTGRGEF